MAGYGELWRARFEMMRPGNAVMAAVGAAVGILLAPAMPSSTVWVATLLAAFLVTAFGNVVNDITDVDVDRRAHPERPLPSGRLQVRDATAFAILLVGFGVLEAWIAGPVLAAFALINAGLLVAYAFWLKRIALLGNLTVAALVASTLAFGALAAGTRPADWGVLWIVLALMLLSNLGRELLKDLEDADADTGRRTFPQAFGVAATRQSALLVSLVVVGLAAWLLTTVAWPLGARLLVAGAAVAFPGAALVAFRDVTKGQRAFKGAMLLALLGLAWAGV